MLLWRMTTQGRGLVPGWPSEGAHFEMPSVLVPNQILSACRTMRESPTIRESETYPQNMEKENIALVGTWIFIPGFGRTGGANHGSTGPKDCVLGRCAIDFLQFFLR